MSRRHPVQNSQELRGHLPLQQRVPRGAPLHLRGRQGGRSGQGGRRRGGIRQVRHGRRRRPQLGRVQKDEDGGEEVARGSPSLSQLGAKIPPDTRSLFIDPAEHEYCFMHVMLFFTYNFVHRQRVMDN